jgi:nucleoid-associated protein YgaU
MGADIDVGTDIAVNAKIIPLMPPGIPVIFSFNPQSITMRRNAMQKRNGNSSSNAGSPAGSTDSIWTYTEPRTLQFKALLEGPQAHTMAQQLLEMLTPAGGLVGMIMAALGVNLQKRLPVLLFEWGPLTLLCQMNSCSVEYKRFHISGVPLRAECTVTLMEAKSWFSMLLTNPTSGGVPGRQQHVMTAGENLQQLAVRSYGAPGRWREIAEVNNIDDPFTVKPGDTVFLPSPAELVG